MSLNLAQRLNEYVSQLFVEEDEILKYVRQQTAAHGLPAHGRLTTIEYSSVNAKLARAHIDYAGLADKVTVLQGDGKQVLQKLSGGPPCDLMFIDADKASYPDYLAWAAENLRVGGALVADNVFWSGQILNPQTEDDQGLARFNRTLAAHPRFNSSILEIGDGFALGVKTN